MRKLLCILTLLLASSQAIAQPVIGLDYADSHIAPGQTIFSGTISCNATYTSFLAFDSTGTTVDDHWLVPDGTRVIVKQLPTSNTSTTVCRVVFADSPVVALGAQGVASTEHDVTDATGAPNGTAGQGALDAIGPWSEVAITVKRNLLYDVVGYRTGLCSAPILGSRSDAQSYTAATDRVRQVDLDVYASCLDDTECQSVAGTPSSATCLTVADEISKELASSYRGGRFARGMHLGCRCTGATRLNVEVKR